MADIICLLVLSAAAITDSKEGKIPNIITIPSILLGIVLTVLTGKSLLLLVASLTLLFLFGGLGFFGMGDIKLLMAVSSLSGPKIMLLSLFLASINIIIIQGLKSPESMKNDVKKGLNMLLFRDIKIDKEGKTIAFAPYLLLGFCITGVLIECGLVGN